MENTEIYKTAGQLVKALLEEKGWSNRLLAAVIEKEETAISKLITDKNPITAELAVLLEEVFKVPAERFLSLQKSYELAKARITSQPDSKRATRAQLFGDLPISEMMARGWINVQNQKNIEEIESELVRFFKTESIEEIEVLPHAAKKTNALEGATPSQVAWLYRVQDIAANMLVSPYSKQKVKAVIEKLKPLLAAPEEARNVPRLLSECGIRFVVVEALKSSKIDGVCCWLDKKSPVIGMTLRFDRMDNFWFVLRHELEHVIQEHGLEKPVLDIDLGSQQAEQIIDEQEIVANNAASEFCAPKARIESFIARKAPLFPERDFLGLAKTLGVHPSLIAGQIQFKTGRYDLFRTHLSKIRQPVVSSAMVDGWGDVAPVNL
jgi:HTH-type transcriptional regulator / antitoxin HigA